MPGFELIDHREREAVNAVFDEGGVLFAHGFDSLRKKYHVKEFERSCEEYFNSKYAIAVSSGTAAIKCALKAAGVKSGDEVITQAFNFIATVEAILDTGAVPVIANIDSNLHFNCDELYSLVTSKTKCIIIVHMLGLSGPVFELKKFCDTHSLCLIEDNCEAVGASVDGSYLGTIGDIGVLSFDHGKNLTCGEGGMCLTNSISIADYLYSYRDHGHALDTSLPRGIDPALFPGFNYRMTELQGAIGKVQLSKLDNLLLLNRQRYDILYEILGSRASCRSTLFSKELASFDTFILTQLTEEQIHSILSILSSNNYGTKNIPDAMIWHCSFFWGHALSNDQVEYSRLSHDRLKESVAIPIMATKPLSFYKSLSYQLSLVFS